MRGKLLNLNHPQPMNEPDTAKAAQAHAAAFRAELDALLRKYGATLNVQDNSGYWTQKPESLVVEFDYVEGRDWIEMDLGRYVDGKPAPEPAR